MRSSPITIAKLLVAIMFFAAVFAGLRSGSNGWFKLIYTATFVALVYATIAARYRGAQWHGFAVAGWAYFFVGFGPWIGTSPGSMRFHAANRDLATSAVLDFASGSISMSASDPIPQRPGGGGPASAMVIKLSRNNRRANRDGLCHCGLTILFAFAGGLVSRALAGRPPTDG